jgi:prepilin-type N-terminal cleavage/methylation domain-containing protein
MREAPLSQASHGWTLAELLVAMAISSVLSLGLVTGAVAVQKSFAASRHHIDAQAQQMLLMDYMTRDLRQALTVVVTGSRLTLTLPDYLNTSGQPRDPHISNGLAVYGPTPRTVSYYQLGTVIYRSEGANLVSLARDVADFQLAFQQSGQSVTASLTFLPKFQFSETNRESVRAGTATYTTTLLRNKRSN